MPSPDDIINRIKRLEDNQMSLDKRITNQVNEFKQHVHDDELNTLKILSAVENNTNTLSEYANKMDGVLTLQRDVIGIFRVATKLQKFMLAITKWGVLGAAVVYGVNYAKGLLAGFL